MQSFLAVDSVADVAAEEADVVVAAAARSET